MRIIFITAVLSLAGIAFTGCGRTASNESSMDHNSMRSNSNMSGMDHSSMPADSTASADHSQMKSSPNAAAQPYDLQFIDTMILHHQGAVDMAKIALSKSTNEELKGFAKKIIDDQEEEIGRMKEWRAKWFPDKPAAVNLEMPGMADSMKMMTGEGMKRMESATGRDFDVMFLDMMTPHHADAVTMAKDALTKAEHAELKTLANQIIKAQEAEIRMMADWKVKWSK